MKNQYSDLHKARFAFLENRSQRSERFLPSLLHRSLHVLYSFRHTFLDRNNFILYN